MGAGRSDTPHPPCPPPPDSRPASSSLTSGCGVSLRPAPGTPRLSEENACDRCSWLVSPPRPFTDPRMPGGRITEVKGELARRESGGAGHGVIRPPGIRGSTPDDLSANEKGPHARASSLAD